MEAEFQLAEREKISNLQKQIVDVHIVFYDTFDPRVSQIAFFYWFNSYLPPPKGT